MRKPRSEAFIFVESSCEVIAPAPIAVKTSSSIPDFRAAVCWKAFMRLKMRSGVGRFVVEGVAIRFVPTWQILSVQIYTQLGVRFAVQFHCPHPGWAGILSFPARLVRGPNYET